MSKPKHDPNICAERDRLQMEEIERLRAALEWIEGHSTDLAAVRHAREALK